MATRKPKINRLIINCHAQTRSPASEFGDRRFVEYQTDCIDYDVNCIICVGLSAFSGEACSLLRQEWFSDSGTEEVCLRVLINDLTVLRSCVIIIPPVYPLHIYRTSYSCLVMYIEVFTQVPWTSIYTSFTVYKFCFRDPLSLFIAL